MRGLTPSLSRLASRAPVFGRAVLKFNSAGSFPEL